LDCFNGTLPFGLKNYEIPPFPSTVMTTQIDTEIIDAAARWHLTVTKIRRDLELHGSPERCELRFAIECSDGNIYIIESLIEDDINHKRKIITRLNDLLARKLACINPYIATGDGKFIINNKDRSWQLSRFIEGISLNRPDYTFEGWRGKALANFLINLRLKSDNIPNFGDQSSFSITNYINTLNTQLIDFEPELQTEIQPVLDFLKDRFFQKHDSLPVVFCHGDYHPLNIIWSDTSIKSVIDWEFSGFKPEIYDMANLIGCIGVETPEALAGDLVAKFISKMKSSGLISLKSWKMLVEFVIAMRFAWLSEWLRYKDSEMIELETVYLKLLHKNADDLKHIWQID